MPTPYIKKLAKEKGVSIRSLESKWDEAKSQAAKEGHKDDYPYITSIFKKMVHASFRVSAAARLRA